MTKDNAGVAVDSDTQSVECQQCEMDEEQFDHEGEEDVGGVRPVGRVEESEYEGQLNDARRSARIDAGRREGFSKIDADWKDGFSNIGAGRSDGFSEIRLHRVTERSNIRAGQGDGFSKN